MTLAKIQFVILSLSVTSRKKVLLPILYFLINSLVVKHLRHSLLTRVCVFYRFSWGYSLV